MVSSAELPPDADLSLDAKALDNAELAVRSNGQHGFIRNLEDYSKALDIATDLARVSCQALGINPDEDGETMAQKLQIILAGMSMGVDFFTTLNSFYITRGRVCLSAAAQRAWAFRSGLVAKWEYEEDQKNQSVSLFAQRSDNGVSMRKVATLQNFASLAGKPDSAWSKYPFAMLQARVTSWMVQALFPDVLTGTMSLEEAEEVQRAPANPSKISGSVLHQTMLATGGELIESVQDEHLTTMEPSIQAAEELDEVELDEAAIGDVEDVVEVDATATTPNKTPAAKKKPTTRKRSASQTTRSSSGSRAEQIAALRATVKTRARKKQ